MAALHGLIFDLEGTLMGDKPDGSGKILFPGAKEILNYFRERHILLGLCTNRSQQSTLQLTSLLGIDHYFRFIAGGDAFLFRKPDARHIKGVIENLGLDATGCVMVGDSTNDVWAAKGAGIPSIVVRHDHQDAIGEDAAISKLSDLPETLRRLGFDFLARSVTP